jgi:methylmalonyl-CoA carboxyltransferase large subunit
MARGANSELAGLLADLRGQVAELADRIAAIEREAEQPEEGCTTEEEILAISAAVAAYLGVRVRIRQVRLVASGAWAQQGRASVQASHQLHS